MRSQLIETFSTVAATAAVGERESKRSSPFATPIHQWNLPQKKEKHPIPNASLSFSYVMHFSLSHFPKPSLSIGNVGQLAVDLLISSIGAQKIGYLDDPSLLPCVGNDAYRSSPGGHIALPLEAYDCPLHALTLIQQRSPIIKGMMIQFAKNFASFAVGAGKKHIVVLSSLDSGKRQRVDLSSSTQIFYLSSTSVDGKDDECEKLGWKILQEYEPTQKRWKYLESLAEANSLQDGLSFEEEVVNDDYYPSLPFAALFSCCKVFS
ncbi:hypothetical protein ACLOJK_041192 [Asimina triloba]